MNSNSASFMKNAKDRPVGEVWVWVTGLGLTIGLAMILFLLAIIFWNGVNYFWPKPVAMIEMAEDGRQQFRGGNQVMGVITATGSIIPENLSQHQDPTNRPAAQKGSPV